MPAALNWINIFNCSHQMWGHISRVKEIATKCGYPYFAWNGSIIDNATDVIVATFDSNYLITKLPIVHPDRDDYPLHLYVRRGNPKHYFPMVNEDNGFIFFEEPDSYALFYITGPIPANKKWQMYNCVRYALHWLK